MKSLQTILTESILDPEGPTMLDEGPSWVIYKTLDKMPNFKYKGYGRYCWSESDKNKFARMIKQGINLKDGIDYKHISEVLDQSGFALPYPNVFNIIAAWDKPSNTYILTRVEELSVAENDDIKKLKKAGFKVRGGEWPTFEVFDVLYEEVYNITEYGHYLMDDFNYDPGIFFPCPIDMNLIKKTLDSKVKGI